MRETEIWQATLAKLEKTTSVANFKTWLKPTKLVSLAGGVAVVSVPNIFFRGWLEKHYRPTIIAALSQQGRAVSAIDFEIAGSGQVDPLDEEVIESLQLPAKPRGLSRAVSTIIRHHTFASFVVGGNNRLAYNVSLTVAKTPGVLHNPLYLYGGVGLGKTHLLHAIANAVIQESSEASVLYVSCETFTNDYIEAIRHRKMDQFKKTYRSVDVLLVDDVQFLANKEGSQEEFFNTYNTLHQANRQIVLAADRPPKSIPGLEERLSSRFGWGMIADIQSPNTETRTAILQSKCQEKRVTLPPEALEYIASHIQSNIRELEGALNRTITYCQMMDVPFSLEATQAALSGLLTPVARQAASPGTVLHLVAEHFGVSVPDLLGRKRHRELVYPRQLAMFLMREFLDLSFPAIARELGGKDHTTVIYGYKKIVLEGTKPKVKQDIALIKGRLAAE